METGVNHRDFISSYSPIGDDEQGHYSVKPEYYGMLAFSLAGKGRLLETQMDSTTPEVKTYATQPDRGMLTLTSLNKGSASRALTLAIGEPMKGKRVSVIRLSAPSVDAKTGVTLGGAEVAATGTWEPSKPEVAQVYNRRLEINLPAASAVIVQIA
jgi:alpha-L-arabinofuranosidase